MRFFLLLTFLVALGSVAVGADAPPSFPLWPNGAPGALGTAEKDIPSLTVFLPEPAKATGAAMVICPGGGYAHLADHEGSGYARWLARNGVAGFVLKYRLGAADGYHHPAMLDDSARALRIVRSRAAEWNVDPKRIGIMGSSAGGHLAASLLTHWDEGNVDATDPVERVSSRPDVGVLCYAVITMGPQTHAGSKKNLLGDNPPDQLVELMSNELHVDEKTPPTFLWSTGDDNVVKVANSMAFAAALSKAKVPFELHVFQSGPHGLGLGVKNGDLDGPLLPWTTNCLTWLRLQRFVK
jgi:acetyl esterase/lipase